MESQDYTVGQVHALTCLGLGKFASIPAAQTTTGQAATVAKTQGNQLLNAMKNKLPKSPAGRTLALGAAVGLGMGAYKLNKGTHSGTTMEAPIIAPQSALSPRFMPTRY